MAVGELRYKFKVRFLKLWVMLYWLNPLKKTMYIPNWAIKFELVKDE